MNIKTAFAMITTKRENERITLGISAEFFGSSILLNPPVTENSTNLRGLPHEEAQE